jgi:hypothetical protein
MFAAHPASIRRSSGLIIAALLAVALAVTVGLIALPQLASGASTKIIEVDAHDTVHNADLTQVIANCPAGYEVTGGGYTIESINPANFVHMDAPLTPEVNDGRWGWAVTMLNESGVDVRLDVSALCMK